VAVRTGVSANLAINGYPAREVFADILNRDQQLSRSLQSMCLSAIYVSVRGKRGYVRVFVTKSFRRFQRKEDIKDAALSDAVERAERGPIVADLGGA
jgi:RelE toxin of RelE / RelB toxin-antitoxin system